MIEPADDRANVAYVQNLFFLFPHVEARLWSCSPSQLAETKEEWRLLQYIYPPSGRPPTQITGNAHCALERRRSPRGVAVDGSRPT